VPRPLRILVAAPAYWPADAFGGPVQVLRRLVQELTTRGHAVDVLTTSLRSLDRPGAARTVVAEVDGARVAYLGTPLRFRWMGITPSLPLHLPRRAPDIVHILGFRDPLGTAVAAWCRRRRIPYVFEGLGMFEPKLRKVALKRALDATLFRDVPRRAVRLIAASEVERREYVAAGLPDDRILIRPNGFPAPSEPARGTFRARLGLGADAPLVLSVGRIARGKGIELLLEAVAQLPAAHLAIVGPDDRHGLLEEIERRAAKPDVAGRIHRLGPMASSELPAVYADADVLALASRHENFGMVAAEAAAVGTAVVVTDRCGVAAILQDRAALVVPYEQGAITGAIERALADPELRRRLGDGGRQIAAEWTWERVGALQEQIYREAIAGA
jgi:glycosyltransferase involved in cell wall biosynthesis